MKIFLYFFAFVLMTNLSMADQYIKGNISSLFPHDNGNFIFKLKNEMPACNTANKNYYFANDGTIKNSKAMVSLLYMASLTGKKVGIKVLGDCRAESMRVQYVYQNDL